jgi:hypothetical protein
VSGDDIQADVLKDDVLNFGTQVAVVRAQHFQ